MIWKKINYSLILYVAVVSSKFSSRTVQQKIEDTVLFDSKSLVNSSFLYGLCQSTNTNKRNSTCNIVLQHINLDINKSNKELSCPVDIAMDVNLYSGTLITLYKIVRVGEDKAVVLLKEKEIHKPEDIEESEDPDYDYAPEFYTSPDYDVSINNTKPEEYELNEIKELKVINVDLKNCRTNTKKILLPISLTENVTVGVLPFEDTYDIVITEKLSNNTILYKGTYSLEGTIIKEMSIWGLRYTNNRNIGYGSVKHYSSDRGYLIFNSINENEQQSFVTIIATLINQETKTLKLGRVSAHKTYNVIYSTSHDVTGICLVYGKNTANCTFLDTEGTVIKKTNIKLDGAHILNMHNLPNGFLLFTEECFDCDQFPLPAFHPGNFQYAVTRFNFMGEPIIKTSLPESSWLKSLHSWTHFFENKAKEICITFLSLKNIPPFVPYFYQNDTLEVIVKCFLDL